MLKLKFILEVNRYVLLGVLVGCFVNVNCHVVSLKNYRIPKQNYKTSIIIPCHYVHFKHLEGLLNSLTKQTVLPDEVIISLSEVHRVDQEQLKRFLGLKYPFSFKVITSTEKQYPGTNRNIAAQYATGQVLICQDADDLPHPQRVEIIKYFFETFDIVHLMHLWVPDNSIRPIDGDCYWGLYKKENIHYQFLGDWSALFTGAYKYLHYGNVAIRNDVLEQVIWPDDKMGEDFVFDQKCYLAFKKTLVINAFLLMYRQHLSSYNFID